MICDLCPKTLFLVCALVGPAALAQAQERDTTDKPSTSMKKNKFALVIHGGAGTIERAQMTPDKERAYRAGLERGEPVHDLMDFLRVVRAVDALADMRVENIQCHGDHRNNDEDSRHGAQSGHPGGNRGAVRNRAPTGKQQQTPKCKQSKIAAI